MDCQSFVECTGLDARLLITRMAYGQAVAVELAEMPLGPVSLSGASLHPYVNWTYEQTWSAKEACYGPVRSVLGLAPGESITLDVLRREDVQITDVVRSAMESSEARTRLQGEKRPGVAAAPSKSISRAEEIMDAQMDAQMESIKGKYASPFLEFFIAEAIADEVTDDNGGETTEEEKANQVANELAKMHEHENGSGAGTINGDSLASIENVLERIESTESHHSFSETTVSEHTVVEQRVRRTFANPYRDRSLELRFIPVFRKFQVATKLIGSEPGIFFKPGHADFSISGIRPKLGDFIQSRVVNDAILAASGEDSGNEKARQSTKRTTAVVDHLNASAGLYTRRLLRHLEERGERGILSSLIPQMLGGAKSAVSKGKRSAHLVNAFAWSRARVRSGGFCVPLAALENSLSVFSKEAGKRLGGAVKGTALNPKWLARWTSSKTVHVFIGTHVEAVAGSCVLHDLPPVATPN